MLEQRERMVEQQIIRRGIDDPRIVDAFRAVPREAFVPDDLREHAYEDRPLPIGEGQTISQPYIVAAMIEAANIGAQDRILEVGAGSGYAAAIMSRLAGQVFAIERHEVLAKQAQERIEALGYDNCTIIAGDGMEGLSHEAPFDAILVAARGLTAPPPLLEQLAMGGRLIIPLGTGAIQHLTRIVRKGPESWESENLAEVRFVPLLPGSVPQE